MAHYSHNQEYEIKFGRRLILASIAGLILLALNKSTFSYADAHKVNMVLCLFIGFASGFGACIIGDNMPTPRFKPISLKANVLLTVFGFTIVGIISKVLDNLRETFTMGFTSNVMLFLICIGTGILAIAIVTLFSINETLKLPA